MSLSDFPFLQEIKGGSLKISLSNGGRSCIKCHLSVSMFFKHRNDDWNCVTKGRRASCSTDNKKWTKNWKLVYAIRWFVPSLGKVIIIIRLVCYMHFNNYFVEHVRGDMNWGGGEGSSRIKKEFTCYFHGLQGGGGALQKFWSFQHIFPFPHPHLYK